MGEKWRHITPPRSFPRIDGHWRLSAGVSFEKPRLNEPGRLFQFSIFPISPFVRLEKSTHWEGTKATEEGLLLRSIGLHCQSFKGKNQGIWRPPFSSLVVRICATGPRLSHLRLNDLEIIHGHFSNHFQNMQRQSPSSLK